MKLLRFVSVILLFSAGFIFSNEPDMEAPSDVKRRSMRIYNNGNYDESIKYCLRNLNSFPYDQTLLLYLAYSYINKQDFQEAERRYLEIIKLNPGNILARNGLSHLYKNKYFESLNSGNINKAIDVLKTAEYYLPERLDFYIKDANLNMKLQNYEEACDLWKLAWENDKTELSEKIKSRSYVLNMIGKCYLHMDDSFRSEWIRYIKKIYKKSSDSIELKNIMAQVYFYNQIEPVKRNRLRNEAMELYCKSHSSRKTHNVAFPLKGTWKITTGQFASGVDTHNGFDGFCIDFVKVTSDGKYIVNKGGVVPSDYPSYDQYVYACMDGMVDIVMQSTSDNPLGEVNYKSTNLIRIKHQVDGRDFYSYYVHLKQNSAVVEKGQTVKKGDLLGRIGNTGISYAPHLHFGFFDENMVSLQVRFENVEIQDNDTICPGHEYSINYKRNLLVTALSPR